MPDHHLEESVTPQQMQCMEVWGGNHYSNNTFEMPGLRVWLFSRPHANARAGGDVCYLSSCASGRITRLLLADVSGHGASVSTTATKLRDIMRKNINRIDQSRFVTQMNQCFSEVTDLSGAFATAVVCTFFAPSKILTMSIAGHPMPLILRHGRQDWSEMVSNTPEIHGLANLPLGVDDRMRYSKFNTRLQSGDRVLIYSDGISECLDESGNMLNSRGLQKLAAGIDSSHSQDFLPRLISRIEELDGQNLKTDDSTAILIEATETPVPMINNFLAPVRIVQSLFAGRTE
ncbi:MAG: PP2C family protein-serine/threonine phosphatase [Planctomycetaceae bacterium]